MSNLTFTKVADLPVAHIQNFYSQDELEKIMNELEYLYSIDRYKGAEEDGGPGTAYEDGVALKVGKGLHLNVVYDDVSDVVYDVMCDFVCDFVCDVVWDVVDDGVSGGEGCEVVVRWKD